MTSEFDTQPPATRLSGRKMLVNRIFSKPVFIDLGWNIHFISDSPIYGDLIKTKKQQQTKNR